ADLDEQKRNARRFRRHTQIGRKRDARARARDRAVQRGDDRLRQLPHVAYERAGQARELKMAGDVERLQIADDVAHVAARTERAPRARDYDNAHTVARAHARETL